MKKILRNLTCGLLLCGGLFAGCADVDDVIEDIPYSRTLTPLNFEAEVVASVGTSITFSWSSVANADSYVLEVFAGIDSTDDDGKEIVVEPDYATALPDYTFDLNPDEVPFTIADMTVDKSYYARVRAVAASIAGSHWAYLTDYVSTSAVRSNLNPVVKERTQTAVTINWDDTEDKTDLTSVRCEPVVAAEGLETVTFPLTDEEKEACSFTVSDLAVCTNYKFTLLFGKSGSRGYVTAWTRPDTEGTTRIESSEAFVNAISSADGDLKLLLAYNDGATYDLTPIMPMNEKEGIFDPYMFGYGLEIYGESSEDGRKPVVKGALSLTSGATKVHFEDVALDGGNNIGVFIVVNKDVAMTDAEFINCDMAGFTKGIWNSVAGCSVDNLIYDGVYVHDVNNQVKVGDANGGDLIDIRGGAYKKVEIKNSTFYACARTFLQISGAGLTVGTIDVRNCTFNQVTLTHTNKNNSGVFHVRHLNKGVVEATVSDAFTLTKCVFLNMNAPEETASSYWVRMTRASNENYAPTCDGNIYYNVGNAYEEIVNDNCHTTFFFNLKSLNLNGETFTEKLALAGDGMMLAEDPCTNSIAGKMYLKNGIIAANRVGDPRWWNASEPVIVRPTELTLVTEPTVWDFTEKTKFQTETLTANTIIENIRIYATEAAPAEIVMNEGVVFSGAAEVSRQGVPQNNAVGFKAMGVGSVKVVAQSGGLGTVQVLAGEDRYTLLADGVLHTVVLGDQVGENMIYVIAGAAVTLTSVEWSDDLTPDDYTVTLKTPAVTVDPASVDVGTSQDVAVTWEAIENAATYEVTFQGQKSVLSEPVFTIPAATVAALVAGDYEISVVAAPVETSTKYAASEAGVGTLKIKRKIVGEEKTVVWDFSKFDGTNIGDYNWTSNTAFTADVVWTVNPDVPLTLMNGTNCDAAGSQIKLGEAKNGISGDVYAPTHRALSFVAPGSGKKLTITHKSGKDKDARACKVSVDGKLVWTGNGVSDGKTPTVETFDLDVETGQKVYIFSKGNNVLSIEYTYVAEPKTYEYHWDFGQMTAQADWAVDSKGAWTDDHEFAVNDRSMTLKKGITLDAGNSRIKMGGKTSIGADGYPTNRALIFTVQGGGILTFEQASASTSAAGRNSFVSVGDGTTATKVAGPFESKYDNGGTVDVSVDLSDLEAGKQVIVWVDNGVNIKHVKWVETR